MLILLLIILSLFILLVMYAASGVVDKSDLKKMENGKVLQSEEYNNTEFTLMTFNCGYFSGMKNNETEKLSEDFVNSNFNSFVNYIKDNPIDIICLQEIDLNSKRTFTENQALRLYTSINYNSYSNVINWNKRYVPFPYWPISAHFGKIVSGQSVLSNFRMIDHSRVVLKKPNRNFIYNMFYLDRLLHIVKINSGNRVIMIFNVHLEAFDKVTRELQAETVLEFYRKYKDFYPVIIAGDFNSVPENASKKSGFIDEPETDYNGDRTIGLFLKEKNLSPAIRISKENYLQKCTFPSDAPDRKLDYIFYDNRFFEISEPKIVKISSSDHLPVSVKFKFKKK